MSQCILRQLRYGISYRNVAAITSNVRCYTRDESEGSKSGLGHTSVLVQKGSDIQELPAILRKLNKDEFAAILVDKVDNNPSAYSQADGEFKSHESIAHLDNCLTSIGILSVVDHISDADLSPEIAIHALERLIQHETLIGLKNLEHSSAVFDRLIECILKNGDHKTLLDFMEVLKTFLDLQKTVQRFCDELLMRNADGILNIIEICECIDRFVECKQYAAAEKFWSGIADNEKLVDDKNIKFIYKILPKLKVSRRFVVGVLERRITSVWWHLSSEAVVDILNALAQCNSTPFRTMQSLARWLNTNIHAVNEPNLESIIKSFTRLDFSSNQIEKALERYVKAKGVRIKAPLLVATILDHCVQFRVRNRHILNGSAEYFIAQPDHIDPPLIKSILVPFGFFDFQPTNSIRFWQQVEIYLKENFSRIHPAEIIEIFLNCCYLEMYPLNFMSSVFNPYFLDLMHTETSPENINNVRSNLKLLDAALTLECENYSGPLLPKDHAAKSIWLDGRIKRIINGIGDQLTELAGGEENMTKSVIVGKLPTNTLYIIDVLIHPPGIGNFWSYSIRSDRNVYVAVLVHLPEYFNSTGEFLIGSQVMRIRHLRRLGIRVVTLNYDEVNKLRMHPKLLKTYLVDRMKAAMPALPEK